ncbi:MAG: hypothetical protein ACREUW_15355 [Burkholderiales bacterium]
MKEVPPERMPGDRPLAGGVEIESAIDGLIAEADAHIRLFDRALTRAWNSPQRHDLLRAFLLKRRTNKLEIVLHETGNLTRDCPRLMLLVKQFSHALAIRRTLPAARRVYDPFAIADDLLFVHRFHFDDLRGVLTRADLAATQLMRKRFAEIWEASTPAMAATTLGL